MVAAELFELFVNREDCWSRQYLNNNTGKKSFCKIEQPITVELIENHIKGNQFIGVYQLNQQNYLKWICFDFDDNTKEDFEKAKKLYDFLIENNKHPMAEYSGGGDFKIHIWIFCNYVKASDAKLWAEQMVKKCGQSPHEIFPKQTELNSDGYGNLVKLPLGIHLVTKKYSKILDNNFNIIPDCLINDKLKSHIYSLDDIIPDQEEKPKNIIEDKQIIIENNLNPTDWDNFFNYTLTHELPCGVSVSPDQRRGTCIEGINSNIIKNQAIWLFKKGYSFEKLITDIKPIYDNNHWAFGDLKGWFVKAMNGSIKDISTGELILWAATYNKDLIQLMPVKEKDEEKYIPKGWACSINIERLAKRHNFLICPNCNNNFEFNIKMGWFSCKKCKIYGGIKDFMSMINKFKVEQI